MSILHRVRMVGTGWQGAPSLNTFYFRNGAGTVPDAADAQLGADRVHAAFTAAAGLFPTVSLFQVDASVDAIEDTNGALVASFGVNQPALIGGSSAAGYQGIALMILATYRTSGIVNGHRVQGRSFLGPVAEAQDTNGTPNNAQLALVAAFGAALLEEGVTGPSLMVWSRPTLTRPGSAHVVTSVGTMDKFAVLRSRRD